MSSSLSDKVFLAGFAGQLTGNEQSVDWYLPILKNISDQDSYVVARSPNWGLPLRGLMRVPKIAISDFGTVLDLPNDLTVRDGEIVIVLGVQYVEIIDSIVKWDPDDWTSFAEGYLLKIGKIETLSQLTLLSDFPLMKTLWSELRRTSDDLELEGEHIERARRILRALGASPTLNRLDYFAAALAVAEAGSSPGEEKEEAADKIRRLVTLELTDSADLLDSNLRDLQERFSAPSGDAGRTGIEQIVTLDDLRSPARTEDPGEGLKEFVEAISEILSSADAGVIVDLSSTRGELNSAYRLDTAKMLLLNNMLSNLYSAGKTIRLIPPDHPAIASQIARGGLATQLVRTISHEDPMYRMWVRPWLPGSITERQIVQSGRLFPVRRDFAIPVHRNLMTFIDPHHSVWDETFVTDVSNAVERWLTGRVFGLVGRPHRQAATDLVSSATAIVIQLMSNIRRHAALSRQPLATTGAGSSSLVQLYTTRGGTKSANRLYISVSDTGIGVPASLRRRSPSLLTVPAIKLVQGALAGEYRSESGDSGFGLAEVYRLIDELDSNATQRGVSPKLMFVTASGPEEPNRTIAHLDRSEWSSPRMTDWKARIRGTVALVSLPLSAVSSEFRISLDRDSQLEFSLGLD